MTKEQISNFANQVTYTHQVTIVTFTDGTQWFGYFDHDTENPTDEKNNFWSFVRFIDKDNKQHFNGTDVTNIEIGNDDNHS